MNKNVFKAVRAALFGLILTGVAVADSAVAPLGTLQAGTNASIQNELGSFPVSGTYTILTGDQIKIGESDGNAVVTMDAGTLYISPESSVTLDKSEGAYMVTLVSGSIGYQLDAVSIIKINSSGNQITPVATDGARSGVVAFGTAGTLVVSTVLGDAIALADDGVVTTITQGNTWTDTELGAMLTPTQVQGGGGLSTGQKWAVGLGSVAGGWLIYDQLIKDDSKSKSN